MMAAIRIMSNVVIMANLLEAAVGNSNPKIPKINPITSTTSNNNKYFLLYRGTFLKFKM